MHIEIFKIGIRVDNNAKKRSTISPTNSKLLKLIMYDQN